MFLVIGGMCVLNLTFCPMYEPCLNSATGAKNKAFNAIPETSLSIFTPNHLFF